MVGTVALDFWHLKRRHPVDSTSRFIGPGTLLSGFLYLRRNVSVLRRRKLDLHPLLISEHSPEFSSYVNFSYPHDVINLWPCYHSYIEKYLVPDKVAIRYWRSDVLVEAFNARWHQCMGEIKLVPTLHIGIWPILVPYFLSDICAFSNFVVLVL